MSSQKTGNALFGLLRFVGVGILSQIALEAVGFKWPSPAQEALPPLQRGGSNTKEKQS